VSLLTFIPSLGTGEVFAFGPGVPLPMRMKFRELPVALRPMSEAGGNTRTAAGASPDRDLINSVIERWRTSTMSHKGGYDEDSGELGSWRDDLAPVREEAARLQPLQPPPAAPAAPPAPSVDPPRPSILRRPIAAGNSGPLPSRYR